MLLKRNIFKGKTTYTKDFGKKCLVSGQMTNIRSPKLIWAKYGLRRHHHSWRQAPSPKLDPLILSRILATLSGICAASHWSLVAPPLHGERAPTRVLFDARRVQTTPRDRFVLNTAASGARQMHMSVSHTAPPSRKLVPENAGSETAAASFPI